MHDHNLDDLIIDESIEPKQSAIKNLFTVVGLLIVLFVLGMILVKLYKTQSTPSPLVTKDDSVAFIAPELKLQTPSKPIENTKEQNHLAITEEEIEEKAEEKMDFFSNHEKPIEKPFKEEKAQQPTPDITEQRVEITQEYTQTPPQVTPPKEPILIPKPYSPPPKSPAVASPNRYYVQVGSFSATPSSRFLSVIRNNGFRYTITKANAKGLKKLLIGPYASRQEVDRVLRRVRDRINKQSFVVKR